MDTSAWSSDDLAPPDGAAWDLVVVGGGTAGLVAAKTAAGFGASVLLVERDRIGGDCLWIGCVPSKTLLSAAHAAHAARTAVQYGIEVRQVTVDFPAVMAHVHQVITTIEPTDSPAAMRAAGVCAAHGSAKFTGPNIVAVEGVPVTFRQALIATGAAPVMPPIPGLAQAEPLTNESVFGLTRLPDRLLVLGGGNIGCELGQAFARLGSHVTIVEAAERLLAREDPDAAQLVTRALTADGVQLRTGVAVTSVRPDGSAWSAVLADGSEIGFDTVLVAVGRRPRTSDLGLEVAGVELDDRGQVRVDARLRTTNPRIWAAGDLTGHPQFTHTAGVHGTLAAANAVLGLRRRVDLTSIPRVTFTQPEVAAVGVGLERARALGLTVQTVEHDEVDRAIAEQYTAGFSRLVLDGKGRVVGATIVGPRAGESLAEAVLAARHGLRARDIAGSTHAYPTYSDGLWKAAIAQVQEQLTAGVTGRAVHALATVRRWTLRAR
ncbi:pyruvate/2-oxoglutarate dehydrogenase complex dihydrolipoamide dehydrogenase (E3) component [Nakamurella sp. UYEF19]|uniref:dihydrolipoyl dehydrogenase family protein n=1 Tax=Nakamurella sp. UYEF19 TaxID=1756392 RepID=UPI003398B324